MQEDQPASAAGPRSHQGQDICAKNQVGQAELSVSEKLSAYISEETRKFRAYTEEIRKVRADTIEAIRKAREDGVRAGKRLAKGEPPFDTPRGRPKLLHDILALLMVDFVDACIAKRKITVAAAVEMYLDTIARDEKAHGFGNSPFWNVLKLDKSKAQAKLNNLYKQIKQGKRNIDPANRDAHRQLSAYYQALEKH